MATVAAVGRLSDGDCGTSLLGGNGSMGNDFSIDSIDSIINNSLIYLIVGGGGGVDGLNERVKPCAILCSFYTV